MKRNLGFGIIKNTIRVEIIDISRKRHSLTLYLLVSSADKFCKQFGPRLGPTTCRAWSGSKLFDALMVFLKEVFEQVDYEKSADDKKTWTTTKDAKS